MNVIPLLRNRLLRYYRRLSSNYHRDLGQTKNTFCSLAPPVIIIIVFAFLIAFSIIAVVIVSVQGPSSSSTLPNKNEDQQFLQKHIDPVITKAQNIKNEKQKDESQYDETSLLALGRITNEADQAEVESGLAKHAFNTLVSDRIGFHRSLPDTRHKLCARQPYYLEDNNLLLSRNKFSENFKDQEDKETSKLLTTSVIICFFNEHFSTLQRTVYSVLERTPKDLLREIILVDDNSDASLVQQLAAHIEAQSVAAPGDDYFTKVRYHRVPERAGLIRARLYGTQFAGGEVLFFLDSHCEVNEGWLEPLLARISNNRKTLVAPIIDLIDPDTMQYKPSPLVRGGFNWGLHFKWDSIPPELLQKPEDFVQPVVSATMAGGLFAIDRKYFHELGAYDEGMRIWGGENLELSFRAWMCGGRLEIVPCSRVGHIFRRRRPYGGETGSADVGGDTLAYNSLRVAHVWMDEYKKYFLASRSDLPSMDFGNVEGRIALRKRLNCSTFEWYLTNIYPELQTPEQAAQSAAEKQAVKTGSGREKAPNLFKKPTSPPTIGAHFLLQLVGSKFCLEADSDSTTGTFASADGTRIFMAPCSKASRLQRWRQTEAGDVRLGPRTCLAVGNDRRRRVALGKCHLQGGTQLWEIEDELGTKNQKNTKLEKTAVQLYNPGSGLCLAVTSSKMSLENLVGNESIKPKVAASKLALKMSFCGKSDETSNLGLANSSIKVSEWKYSRWTMVFL